MKKLFLTFLLVLMPLQFVQAATCPYCCDDDMPMSTQQQEAESEAAIVVDDRPTHATFGPSHRCGFCNLAHAQYISSEITLLTPQPAASPYLDETLAYQSYIPRGLDRPNWTHFA